MPYKQRILYREALYWFSFSDYMRFKNSNYHIVTLGADCFSRVLITAIKLKPRRFYGEKSCPFDLSFNYDFNKIVKLIENDFIDFFSDINMNNFPHDIKLSHSQFVERYKNRIQNFQNVMQSDKIIYFIYSNYKTLPLKKDILNLYNVLKKKRNDKPFKLIILTSEYIEGLQDIIQIPYKFQITDPGWMDYIINEYGTYNNKYTQYCAEMKEKLTEVIFDNYFC